jgi:hypothetical protein
MNDTRTISQLEAEGYPLDRMRVLQGYGVGAVQDDPLETVPALSGHPSYCRHYAARSVATDEPGVFAGECPRPLFSA